MQWRPRRLGDVLTPVMRSETVDQAKEYRLLGVRLDGDGPFHRETKLGAQTAASKLSQVQAGDFIYSRLFAWRGAFGVINSHLDGCYVSGEFPTFRSIADVIDAEFLRLWFRLPTTIKAVEARCSGSTPLTRNRFKEHYFLAMEIPLPPLDEQRRIVARIEELAAKIKEARGLRRQAVEEAQSLRLGTIAHVLGSLGSERQLGEWDVAQIICGQHLAPDEQADGGTPYITGPADFGERVATPSRFAAVIKATSLPRDVLLTVKGAGVGKVNLAPPFQTVIGRQLFAVRPSPDALDQIFLWYMLQHKLTDLRNAITATTVPGIGRDDVETLAWIIHENIYRNGLAADGGFRKPQSPLWVPKSVLEPI